jgi:hypothetical protein
MRISDLVSEQMTGLEEKSTTTGKKSSAEWRPANCGCGCFVRKNFCFFHAVFCAGRIMRIREIGFCGLIRPMNRRFQPSFEPQSQLSPGAGR